MFDRCGSGSLAYYNFQIVISIALLFGSLWLNSIWIALKETKQLTYIGLIPFELNFRQAFWFFFYTSQKEILSTLH